MQHLIPVTPTTSIATLNDLLRGERAAVAAYELARRRIPTAHATALTANHACHAQRRTTLSARIVELGGRPATALGTWAGFPTHASNEDVLLDPPALLVALARSEDLALDTCYEALADLDHASLNLVLQQVLPAQKRSLARMTTITGR